VYFGVWVFGGLGLGLLGFIQGRVLLWVGADIFFTVF
jgi:hypothetical protein